MAYVSRRMWIAGVFTLCLAAIGPAFADDGRIAVIGEGTVAAVPDMARINLGVSAQDSTAAAAFSAVAEQMGGVVAALESNQIEARDIQTDQINVQPVYQQSDQRGERPEVVGYEARSDVTVRVRNLDGLGALLDLVAQSGGNQFSGFSFAVQDPAPLLNQARQAAVADAMAKAALYAGAANVALGDVIEISEDGASPAPMPMMESASFRSMPIAAGELEINARVRMIFELKD
ncbi:SIMPL domain-containing protein [Oceaniglobus ichthyenteri]|uniref:SIMPL domain-containing protein n=1 Tax=Oceaniglobus ichthyenteri TaxID=2136177 RepID=UPI001F0B8BFA|nr:SIMPL domain-containing protein [Oceaniglobus ichthyenteri]